MIKRSLVAAALFALSLPVYAAQGQRVFIEYKEGQQAAVLKKLSAGGAKVHFKFGELNAVVATVPDALMSKLTRDGMVTRVSEDPKRYPMAQTVPYGIDMIQARAIWDVNHDGVVDPNKPTGESRMLCIIDSGIDVQHEDLAPLNIVGGEPEGWNNDTCGHGSHVAGTIAAANNDVGVVGVSPGAVSLYILKVFDGPECGYSYASSVLDAAYACEAAGASVISMSLGGGRASPVERIGFGRLNRRGILSVAAAGNAGDTSYSYPASYPSVLSVAAVDQNEAIASFSQQNDEVDVAAPGVNVLSTVPFTTVASFKIGQNGYEVLGMEGGAYGTVSGAIVYGGLCTEAGEWAGMVVLCQRGEVSFAEKAAAVEAGGGVAAVVYNNEPGLFGGTLGEEEAGIPVLSMSQENGTALVETQIGANAAISVTLVTHTYEYYSGTSMATPHVSAAAAVLLSSDPSLTNEDVRAALIATAKDLGPEGPDNAFGAGLIQMFDAWRYLGGGPGNNVSAVRTPLKTRSDR